VTVVSAPDADAAVSCAACRATLRSGGRDALSVLLVDRLRIPVVGCDDHLDRFAATCDLGSDGSTDLLGHRPAGGITCPTCRLAPRSPEQALVAVDDGAVAVVACPRHRDAVVDRFAAGARTRRRLPTDLPFDAGSDPEE
jgi:hypothetical protein